MILLVLGCVVCVVCFFGVNDGLFVVCGGNGMLRLLSVLIVFCISVVCCVLVFEGVMDVVGGLVG